MFNTNDVAHITTYRSADGKEYRIDDPNSMFALLAQYNPGIIDQVAELYEGVTANDELYQNMKNIATEDPSVSIDDLYNELGFKSKAKIIEDMVAANPRLSINDLYAALGFEDRVKFFNTDDKGSHLPLLKNAPGLLPGNFTAKDYKPYKYYDYETQELKDRKGGHYPPPGYSAGRMEPGAQRNLLLYALSNMRKGDPIVASLWKSHYVDPEDRKTHGPWHEYTEDGIVDPTDEVVIKPQPKLDEEAVAKQLERFDNTATTDLLEIDNPKIRRIYKDKLGLYNDIMGTLRQYPVFEGITGSPVDVSAFTDLMADFQSDPSVDYLTDVYQLDNNVAKDLFKKLKSFLEDDMLDDLNHRFLRKGITPPWVLDNIAGGPIDKELEAVSTRKGIPNKFAGGKVTPAMARAIATKAGVNVNDVKKFAEGAATGKKPSDIMLKAIRGQV